MAESIGPVPGEIENISISGAFVRVARLVPLWARLEVQIIIPGHLEHDLERVAAHVTRWTRAAVGIEWCELAPRLVRGLLHTADPLAGPLARPEIRRGIRPDLGVHAPSLAKLAACSEIPAIRPAAPPADTTYVQANTRAD